MAFEPTKTHLLIVDHDVQALEQRREKSKHKKKQSDDVENIYAVFGPCKHVPKGMQHFETADAARDYIISHKTIKGILSGYRLPKAETAYGEQIFGMFNNPQKGSHILVELVSNDPESINAQKHPYSVHSRWQIHEKRDENIDPVQLLTPNNKPYFTVLSHIKRVVKEESPAPKIPAPKVQQAKLQLPMVLAINLLKPEGLNSDPLKDVAASDSKNSKVVKKIAVKHTALGDNKNYYEPRLTFERLESLDWYLDQWQQHYRREHKDHLHAKHGITAEDNYPGNSFKGAVIGINDPNDVDPAKAMIQKLKEHDVKRIVLVVKDTVSLNTTTKKKLREKGAQAIVGSNDMLGAVQAAAGQLPFTALSK